jgi:hypothetical protein
MPEIISPPKANIVIDATNLDLFDLCPARYNYRVNLRRGLPAIQKNRSLDIGGLLHEGFEAYYKALAQQAHFDDAVEKASLAIRVKSSDPEESNVDVLEAEGLIKILQENLDFWRHEDEHLIIHSVEAPFAYVLYEDDEVRILVTGKIDLLVDRPALGGATDYKNLPIDHKSRSRTSDTLRLSNQFQNYCVATNSNYLIVNIVGLQKSLKPDEKYKRIPLSYDHFLLQQWKDNTIKIILDQYLTCVSERSWPMRLTSCLKFNRRCEYYEVCDSSGEEAKAFKLENNYIHLAPFDVTKGMGNED